MKKFLTIIFLSLSVGCFGAETGASIFFESVFKGLFYIIGITALYLTGLICFAFILKKVPILGISILISVVIFAIFFGHMFIWVP